MQYTRLVNYFHSETFHTLILYKTLAGDLVATIQQFNELQAKKKNGKKENINVTKQKHLNKKKEIISGVSAYFNPGELVAVMGPSGNPIII